MFDTQTKFEDSLFYDVSAWTFPLAFNLNYEFLKENLMGMSCLINVLEKLVFFKLWIFNKAV